MVTCSPRDPRFADSNPTEIDGFFQDVKILSKSPPGKTLGFMKSKDTNEIMAKGRLLSPDLPWGFVIKNVLKALRRSLFAEKIRFRPSYFI